MVLRMLCPRSQHLPSRTLQLARSFTREHQLPFRSPVHMHGVCLHHNLLRHPFHSLCGQSPSMKFLPVLLHSLRTAWVF